jgi:hypothetical protein
MSPTHLLTRDYSAKLTAVNAKKQDLLARLRNLGFARVTANPEVIRFENDSLHLTVETLHGSEGGFAEITADLLEARFWVTSGWPTNREVAWQLRKCALIRGEMLGTV